MTQHNYRTGLIKDLSETARLASVALLLGSFWSKTNQMTCLVIAIALYCLHCALMFINVRK